MPHGCKPSVISLYPCLLHQLMKLHTLLCTCALIFGKVGSNSETMGLDAKVTMKDKNKAQQKHKNNQQLWSLWCQFVY